MRAYFHLILCLHIGRLTDYRAYKQKARRIADTPFYVSFLFSSLLLETLISSILYYLVSFTISVLNAGTVISVLLRSMVSPVSGLTPTVLYLLVISL